MTNSAGRRGAFGPAEAAVRSLATMQRCRRGRFRWRPRPRRPGERWESHLVTLIMLVVVLFDVEKFGVTVEGNDRGECYLCRSRRARKQTSNKRARRVQRLHRILKDRFCAAFIEGFTLCKIHLISVSKRLPVSPDF